MFCTKCVGEFQTQCKAYIVFAGLVRCDALGIAMDLILLIDFILVYMYFV